MVSLFPLINTVNIVERHRASQTQRKEQQMAAQGQEEIKIYPGSVDRYRFLREKREQAANDSKTDPMVVAADDRGGDRGAVVHSRRDPLRGSQELAMASWDPDEAAAFGLDFFASDREAVG